MGEKRLESGLKMFIFLLHPPLMINDYLFNFCNLYIFNQVERVVFIQMRSTLDEDLKTQK